MKQPIFGANYLTGYVIAEHGGMIVFVVEEKCTFCFSWLCYYRLYRYMPVNAYNTFFKVAGMVPQTSKLNSKVVEPLNLLNS